MSITIDCVSDLHLYFGLQLNGGDILVVAGDISYVGKPIDFIEFNHWLGKYKDKYKAIVFVAGNHDWAAENAYGYVQGLLTNVTHYLQDEPAEILGLKFYGSPRTPEFNDWAFNVPRGKAIKKYWDAIPSDTEVLVTHGPPMGILDECPAMDDATKLVHVGCEELLKKVKKLKKLKAHIYGHIHESNGIKIINKVQFVNASIMTGDYQPTQPYHTITL